MQWEIDDLLGLAEVLASADFRSFTVRRTFARLEAGEITPLQASIQLERVTPRRLSSPESGN